MNRTVRDLAIAINSGGGNGAARAACAKRAADKVL
jgi:hypothetical protein